ncbi:hypothetical protein CA830_25065, partial [Burkholderia multivorans]
MTSPFDAPAGRPQRFSLRASAVSYVVLAGFVAVAAASAYLFCAPRAGIVTGACAAAATAALLA